MEVSLVDLTLAIFPTRAIATWAANLRRSRTIEVRREAIAAIQDVVGCMLAGSVEPTSRAVADAIENWGDGGATVIGTSRRAAAPWAALANGTSAHVLDYDDSFSPLTGHAAATLVPAVLALAEERNADGPAVIDALVVGLEVVACIGRAMNPFHYAAGWHSTSTIGVIGSAVACGRLLKLNADQLTGAISLAVSSAGGTRMQLGSSAKSIHAGLAAKDGVVAATLAENGLAGCEEALIGRWRFAEMYGASATEASAFALPAEDEPLAVVAPGMTFKPYPTCGSMHRSVDAIIALRNEHGFSADDVKAIDTIIPAVNRKNLIYAEPRNGMEARFSMQYCAAVAAIHGSLCLADFQQDAIFRPEVRALMPKVVMHDLPGSESGADDYLDLPAITSIKLNDEQILSDTRYVRRGSPHSPMTQTERAAKFSDCASTTLDKRAAEGALGFILDLSRQKNIGPLMRALCSKNTRPC